MAEKDIEISVNDNKTREEIKTTIPNLSTSGKGRIFLGKTMIN